MKKSYLHLLTVGTLLVFLAACTGESNYTATSAGEGDPATVREIQITAGPNGYDPERITLTQGEPVRIVFTRTTPSPCLEQVQIPEFNVGPVDLPMNEPVAIAVTPEESGEFTFACGMDMQHGTLVVSAP